MTLNRPFTTHRELDRRARMEVGRRERESRERHFSQVDLQSGNNATRTRTTTTLTDSSAAARLRQRSTAVLSRIAAGGSHSRHRVLSRRGVGGAASGSGRNSPGSRSGRYAFQFWIQIDMKFFELVWLS